MLTLETAIALSKMSKQYMVKINLELLKDGHEFR